MKTQNLAQALTLARNAFHNDRTLNEFTVYIEEKKQSITFRSVLNGIKWNVKFRIA